MRTTRVRTYIAEPFPALRPALLGAVLLLAAGCQQTEMLETRAALDAMNARIELLDIHLAASRAAIDDLALTDAAGTEQLDSRLTELGNSLEALPAELEGLCPEPPAPVPVQCPEPPPVEQVIVTADKMLVGELEHAWIDPPGIPVVARMDTGATSSSLHAENLERFERDSEDWVRFDVVLADKSSVTVERKIIRYARVIQQADPEGSRRPVVAMRVRLGELQETYEFTLADRSHLENELILGRNFLADVTLIDVGRQFIQPRYQPPSATSR